MNERAAARYSVPFCSARLDDRAPFETGLKFNCVSLAWSVRSVGFGPSWERSLPPHPNSRPSPPLQLVEVPFRTTTDFLTIIIVRYVQQ